MNTCRRLLIALPLVALLCAAPGCALLRRDSQTAAPAQSIGQLTSHRTGDNERALRMGRDILREEGMLEKYDVNTATAYERGDQWEVCFTPKRGPFKRLRKRCFVFTP